MCDTVWWRPARMVWYGTVNKDVKLGLQFHKCDMQERNIIIEIFENWRINIKEKI